MRKTTLLLVAFLIIGSCKQNKEEVDIDDVISQYNKSSDGVERAEYKVQRIDTFPSGDVWNNQGFAVIEKNEDDKIFGYSFYGKRNDFEKGYLYDTGTGFEIQEGENSYRLMYPQGMLGLAGGQMVVEEIFSLDSINENASLIEEDTVYVLEYSLEPDTLNEITDRFKTIELRKEDFFPTKVTYQRKKLGNKVFTQHILSDIHINDKTETSISKYKDLISHYDIIQPVEPGPNKILNKEFPNIKLPNLFDENEIVKLQTDKLILIDFWEVWCSPCIKSFPQVEELSKKYQDDLRVVGIVSQSKESAKNLVKNKNLSFLNLLGTNNLLEKYSVNSYPRYFLIDRKGIVKKEYYGFSAQIEKDIQTIISE